MELARQKQRAGNITKDYGGFHPVNKEAERQSQMTRTDTLGLRAVHLQSTPLLIL